MMPPEPVHVCSAAVEMLASVTSISAVAAGRRTSFMCCCFTLLSATIRRRTSECISMMVRVSRVGESESHLLLQFDALRTGAAEAGVYWCSVTSKNVLAR
jgi:hypothetical protein